MKTAHSCLDSDTDRNLQWHRVLLPVIARLLFILHDSTPAPYRVVLGVHRMKLLQHSKGYVLAYPVLCTI